MVRKPDDGKNRKIRAYLIQGNNDPKIFYCNRRNRGNISSNIGHLYADGEHYLVTNADLNFKINDLVRLSDTQTLTIEDIEENLIENDNNGLRGNPRYEKVLLVK